MANIYKVALMTFMAFVLLAGSATASLIGAAGPAGYNSDDYAEFFDPLSFVLTVELEDLAGSFGLNSYFGFYYQNAPSDLVTIFGSEDQGTSGTQVAGIDFSTGDVYDLDDSTVQSTFVQATGPIAFFLYFDDGVNPGFYLDTQAAQSEGAMDAAATFSSILDPSSYLLAFENPYDTTEILSLHVVAGITPVPEPSTLLILGSGLVALAGYGGRRIGKRPVKS